MIKIIPTHPSFRRIIALLAVFWLCSAPAAAMTDMQGKALHVNQLIGKGKWTVFEVWVSTCHVCQSTVHYMNEFKARFPAADVYGISLDGAERKQAAENFIQRHRLNFPNLLSDGSEFDTFLYRTTGEFLVGTPTLMVYNPQGQLAAVQPGVVTPQELITFIRDEEKRAANP
ncbi:MAG: TlpA disulfide reductase family protein [Thiolinea sp.]